MLDHLLDFLFHGLEVEGSRVLPIGFASLASAEPYIKDGTLRAIAVTSKTRAQSQPDVPTMAEAGYPNIEGDSWVGVLVPAGTPEEVIKRVVAAQKACSFSEITIVPQFGTMPYDEAEKRTKLFAQEVLPVIHKMEAPLNAAALPPRAVA